MSAAWRACGMLSAMEFRLTLDSTIYACIVDHMHAQYLTCKIRLASDLRVCQKWESVGVPSNLLLISGHVISVPM